MTMGEKIKSRRVQLGLTQEELANKVGTKFQNIYKYEAGIVTNMPLERVSLLADALDVSPSYLMGWNDKKPLAEHEGQMERIMELYLKVPEENRAMVVQMIEAVLKSQGLL